MPRSAQRSLRRKINMPLRVFLPGHVLHAAAVNPEYAFAQISCVTASIALDALK